MIQRKTYTNNLSPTSCMKLGDEKRFSNSSDLKKYFTQNNMETNEADIINGKSSFKNLKNKLIFSIFLMMALLVNAQNIEVRAYNDQSFPVKADTFTGSGYATVNGGSTSSIVTQASISTMPSSVSGYAGVHVVVYSQWTGTLPTSAQFDALVEFIRQGGVVIANVEREGTTFREILDRLMGTSHGITKTLAGTAGISPVNFVHPGEGTLKLRSATNTSTPTTTSYSTFAGVPSAARILHGTSNSGCNGTCLDFVVPTFPGVATTLNGQTVRGMLIMSGEVQGPLTGGGSVRSLAMDQSYAKLIYDFYNSPSAMVSRRAWSATSTNQNPICVPATFVEPCNAGSTAPTLSGTTITNTCPTTTVNLNSLHTGTAPTGSSLVWFTNNAHTGTTYATPTAAVAGTYYAFYYDATNNCYSPVSTPLSVTINSCIPDTDGDGLTDDIDIDDDNDGILDSVEGYCSSTPILLTKATYTATGSGTGGRPVVNFTAPVTGSGRRLLLLYLNIERDHTPSAYGDNWESTIYSNGFTGMPTVSFGGVNMIKRNYAYQFHGVTTDGATAKLSNSQFLYSLSDANITSGNNSFDLSNFNLPLSAGDEWKATVIVYDQVNYSEYVSASGFNSSNNFPSTLSTSGAMLSPTQPAGLSESNNTLIALGQISNSNGMQLTSSWNTINSGTITNSNGTYASDPGATSGSSENDGISNYIASITGVTGTQTINFNVTNNALLGGLMLYRIVGYACTIRDTDGDGTPDYLDLDSDGDGCPDAIEGDENVTASQLTANRISGAVDANGVPVLVNSGGAADVGADQGQGIGQSQDASKNDCIDSDGDGVPDWQDLDDDNDGILDCIENNLNKPINQIFELNGNAIQISSSEVQLTPASNTQAGQMWSYGKVDFTKNFSIPFEAYLGNNDGGADGMAIVFQNDPAGINAVGINGDGIGARGIQNGVVLELDTYSNSWSPPLDPVADHGQIWKSSDQSAITSTVSLPNLEDGAWHNIVVNWDSFTQTLSYTVDGTVAGSYTGNVVTNYFGGANKVRFGFTASTGGFNNDQRVRFSSLCSLPLDVDTDGDGIPNHLDLDSDGDGCADAIEGDENVTASQLTANRISGAVDANGVPVLVNSGGTADIGADQGQGIGQSQDASKNNCIDSDGDGVPDWQDLDDDNDGILDTVEYGQCSSAIPANGAYVKQNLYLEDFGTLPNLGSSSSNTYGILQTIPSWSANVTGMTYDTTDGVTDGNWTLTVNPNYIDDFSTNIWNGTSLFDSQWLDTLDYTSGDVNGLFFAANPNDAPVGGSQLYRTPNIIVLPNVPLKASLWLLNMKKVGASGTDPIIKIDIVNASDNSIISTSTQSVAETGLWTEVSTTFSTGTTATSVYIRITNMVTSASGSGNDFGVDGISLDLTFCDLDSDGIPNYLDLDSDNDGCLDALEGGANITSSQLVNAGGTVTVGTGSTAANQNLCATSTCVDANGVPTIVSGGQSIGDSQNAAIKSGCFCYKPAQTTGTTLDTNHGITALGRAGADNGNWPMVRKGAWTALEAKTKGFVINRIPTTAQVIAIPNPVEGMMVYDEETDCLKIYTTTDNGATYSWQCFNTQTCPE